MEIRKHKKPSDQIPPWDHVEPDPDRKEIKPLKEGIAPGTVRGSMLKVRPADWCGGAPKDSPWHKWSNTVVKFCTICGADYDES